MKNDPIETARAQLDDADPHTPAGRQQILKALASRYPLVTAKAAKIAGESLEPELQAPLITAFARLMARSDRSADDKGCVALTALARALVALDTDDAALFRRGMKHIQKEAVWGGSIDVAADFRATCAMGLANSRDPHKLQPMVELLADPEGPARSGAVKAITVIGSDSASLLLRYKALLGDPEPDVLTDVLTGLLEIDGAEAIPLVGRVAESKDQETREAALLALGTSRRPDAVEWLKTRFDNVADPDTKKCILLALATARTEAAMDFVLDIIRDGSSHEAANALSALGVFRADPRLREEITHAAMTRPDGESLLRKAGF